MAKKAKLKIVEIPLKSIDPPSGVVRLEIDPVEVDSLAASVKEVGLLVPIGIRKKGERYEIVDGHRRYLAHKLLEREKIACIIRDVDDAECALARATENLRRVDLTPIEEAAIYEDLCTQYKLTVDEVGRRMGKTAGVVRRRLDLLKMVPQLQKAIHQKQINYGVAEELSRLKDAGKIDYYLGYARDHGITVSVARQWVNDEFKRQRTEAHDIAGGGGACLPLEEKPIYVSCDICHGPMLLGEDTVIRGCKQCVALVKTAVVSGGRS